MIERTDRLVRLWTKYDKPIGLERVFHSRWVRVARELLFIVFEAVLRAIPLRLGLASAHVVKIAALAIVIKVFAKRDSFMALKCNFVPTSPTDLPINRLLVN